MPLTPLLLVLLIPAAKGERRLDGGPVVSAGFELAVTHVRLSGEGVTRGATLVGLLTVYQADWNFTRYVGLGLRGGAGGLFNGGGFDTFQAFGGPTLTIYLGSRFYFGADAWLQLLRFHEVSSAELDGDLLLGFAFGLRLGLVFEIANVVTVVPELRAGAQPLTPVRAGAAFTDASRIIEAERALAFTGGLGVAARFFF